MPKIRLCRFGNLGVPAVLMQRFAALKNLSEIMSETDRFQEALGLSLEASVLDYTGAPPFPLTARVHFSRKQQI